MKDSLVIGRAAEQPDDPEYEDEGTVACCRIHRIFRQHSHLRILGCCGAEDDVESEGDEGESMQQ
jgi:hypothetical protein